MDKMLMIYGECRHFWRKRKPLPRHGPIEQPGGDYISLPPIARFCGKCIGRINAHDFKFVGYVAPDNMVPGGWRPVGPYVPDQ